MVEFSRDGQYLITASSNRTARIWYLPTGQPVSDLLQHETQAMEVDKIASSNPISAAVWGLTRIADASISAAFRGPADGELTFVGFDTTNQVAISAAGHWSRVWHPVLMSEPAPEWLPALAEAVAEKQLNTNGVFERVPRGKVLELKSRILALRDTNRYAEWAHWFFDRSTRAIAPFSKTTPAAYVQRLIRDNTEETLREALRIDPSNALAWTRLGEKLMAHGATNSIAMREGLWCSKWAVSLAP